MHIITYKSSPYCELEGKQINCYALIYRTRTNRSALLYRSCKYSFARNERPYIILLQSDILHPHLSPDVCSSEE